MKSRLGRGLDSLIGSGSSSSDDAPQPGSISKISCDTIEPNPYQPRREMGDAELASLADSVSRRGVLQPILVRRADGRHQLIAGERRWRAAQSVGLAEIPAIVLEADEVDALEIALLENIQREELSAIDKAYAVKDLTGRFDWTQEQVAERIGISRPQVANLIRLLDLPEEVQDDVSRGTISMGHARAILGLTGSRAIVAMARRIAKEGLSVRQVERIVRKMRSPTQPTAPGTPTSPQIALLEDAFRSALGTKVVIEQGQKKGTITIEFYSNDDFNRLFTLITNRPPPA